MSSVQNPKCPCHASPCWGWSQGLLFLMISCHPCGLPSNEGLWFCRGENEGQLPPSLLCSFLADATSVLHWINHHNHCVEEHRGANVSETKTQKQPKIQNLLVISWLFLSPCLPPPLPPNTVFPLNVNHAAGTLTAWKVWGENVRNSFNLCHISAEGTWLKWVSRGWPNLCCWKTRCVSEWSSRVS